jgi:hypothetical protein
MSKIETNALVEAMRRKLRAYSEIDEESGCWIWTKAVQQNTGRGLTTYNGQPCYADEIAYRLFIGPIPPDQKLAHHCVRRECINPAHMLLVVKRTPKPFDSTAFVENNVVPQAVADFIRDRVMHSHAPHDLLRPAEIREAFFRYIADRAAYKACLGTTKNRFGRVFNAQFNPTFVRQHGTTFVRAYLIDKENRNEKS